jgi:hypothetical protein
MFEGLIDGRTHITGLSQSHNRSIARADCDLGLVAVLFHGQDHFGVEFIAQNFADFCKAVLYGFANGGSDFILPAGIFHVHERPSGYLSFTNWALQLGNLFLCG